MHDDQKSPRPLLEHDATPLRQQLVRITRDAHGRIGLDSVVTPQETLGLLVQLTGQCAATLGLSLELRCVAAVAPQSTPGGILLPGPRPA
jgi:hypothetical protein